MTLPRIAPLGPADRDTAQRQLVEDASGRTNLGALNIFTTFVRHTRLFRRWLPFSALLLVRGTLPARDREILILRTAHNCDGRYELDHHRRIGRTAGLTDEEIKRVCDGPHAGWQGLDHALLLAADELAADHVISDATWQRLAAQYNECQLIEVPFVVGHYTLLAYALNSLGVQDDAVDH